MQNGPPSTRSQSVTRAREIGPTVMVAALWFTLTICQLIQDSEKHQHRAAPLVGLSAINWLLPSESETPNNSFDIDLIRSKFPVPFCSNSILQVQLFD
ncbi:hypothetical protein BaRGS_00024051 [Batillaria attramentaria]|uniref:Uncharacterized protein n=1 Tax=Batillaria attramentaria TaxID=370345 RepID=A0ABD0KBZ7_9CAEN